MGKLHGLDRAAGITGKADADDHILRPNAQELFEHLAGGGRMDDRDIIKDQVKIEAQKACNGGGGTHAQNVDVAGGDDGVHRLIELRPVGLLQREVNLLDIRLHDHGQDVLIADTIVGDLDALHGSELAADHLLQGLLHGGISVVAQLRGKAHHRGLADAHRFAQLAGRHEGRLVVRLQDEICNELLSLGKGAHIRLDQG